MKISAVQTVAGAVMLALVCAASAATPHQRLPASAQVADQPAALLIPYIPRVGQANEGFFSFENYGDTEASVSLWLYDERGNEVANILVSLPAGVTRWLNSKDLTHGNTSKGVSVIPRGTARSPSLWARVKANGEKVQILAYMRSNAGFVTAMSRTGAPASLDDGRRAVQLPFFNPGSNKTIRSELRLVNPTDSSRTVRIGAWDSNGDFGEGVVQCTLSAHAVVRLMADALEAGPEHPACTGDRWGDGAGKWFVQVEDTEVRDEPLIAMSLLYSTATGLVTNVSMPALTVIGEAQAPVDLAPEDWRSFYSRVRGKKFIVRDSNGSETADYRFTSDSFFGGVYTPGSAPALRFTVRFSSGETVRGSWKYTKGEIHQAVLKLGYYGPAVNYASDNKLAQCFPVNLLFTTRNAGRLSATCTGAVAGGDGTFGIADIF